MSSPKVPPPVSTGWADFGAKSFAVPNDNVKTEQFFDFGSISNPHQNNSSNENWFDFVDAANMQNNQPKSVSNIVKLSFIYI